MRLAEDLKNFRAQRKWCDRFWFQGVPSVILVLFVVICILGS